MHQNEEAGREGGSRRRIRCHHHLVGGRRGGSIACMLLLLLLLVIQIPVVEGGWTSMIWCGISGGSKSSIAMVDEVCPSSPSSAAVAEAIGGGAAEGIGGGGGVVGGEGGEGAVEVEELIVEEKQGENGTGEAVVEEKPANAPRLANFKAKRSQTTQMEVRGRQLHDFFLSEASRSSILNANNFQQLGPNTFRCEMEPIQFFSASIIPVVDIVLKVDTSKKRASIHAISNEIKTSEVPAGQEATGFAYGGAINESSFHMNTQNVVSWKQMNVVSWKQMDDNTIKLSADLSMEISMQKPSWLLGPNYMVDRVGGMVLQQVLKKTLPEFLDRITNGYYEWAASTSSTATKANLAGGGLPTTTVI